MAQSLFPAYVTKYFWGDDLQELDLERNKKYIVQTLLDQGDEKALHWLFSRLDAKEIKNFLPEIKLSKKSSNFWKVYLS